MAKKILRINMTSLKASYEEVPEKWSRWAGRALTDAIVCDEVDPLCHPLGPNNKVVIAKHFSHGFAFAACQPERANPDPHSLRQPAQ